MVICEAVPIIAGVLWLVSLAGGESISISFFSVSTFNLGEWANNSVSSYSFKFLSTSL